MKSEIHALIASLVSDQEAPSETQDFSVSNITEAVSALVKIGNDGVSPERRATLKSALIVAERSLTASARRNVETRAFNLVRDVNNFITLSKEGRVGELEPANTDLLSIGHPLSTAPHSMGDKELRIARSRWIATDPRISDEYRSLVASAYATAPESLEQDFAIARLKALPKGSVPAELVVASAIEAITAGIGDGNSSAARRARVKLQWRDRYGRWVEMGRGVRFKLRMRDGSVRDVRGRFVGGTSNPAFGRVLVQNSDDPNIPNSVYLVNSRNGEAFEFELSEEVLERSGIDTEKLEAPTTVTEQLDKDIQDIATIKTLAPNSLDEELAGGATPEERSTAKELQKKSPIAKLPAGAEAESVPQEALIDFDKKSFPEKVAFNTDVDIPLVDERLKEFLAKDKSLKETLDPKKFGKYLKSNSPVSDALIDFEAGKLSEKDLVNLFGESSYETSLGDKNKELSNVLQGLADYFEKDYDPQDYSDEDKSEPIAFLPETAPEAQERLLEGLDYDRAQNDPAYVSSFLDGFDAGVYAAEKKDTKEWSNSDREGYEAGYSLGGKKHDQAIEKAQQDLPQYGQEDFELESRQALSEAIAEISKPFYDELEKQEADAIAKAAQATEEGKVVGERFTDWTVPAGAYPLQNDEPYEVSGAISDVYGADATDDPKVLASSFDRNVLEDALTKAVSETGDFEIDFAEAGPVPIPAEALYDALREQGVNADGVVAKAYDNISGKKDNQINLKSFRDKSPKGEIAELDSESIEKSSAKELNQFLIKDDLAGKAVDLIEANKTTDGFGDADLQIVADSINSIEIPKKQPKDYLERPVGKLLAEYLPWAFSDDESKKQAFRGLLGLVSISDGNEGLITDKGGVLESIYKKSEFYDDSVQDPTAKLSEAIFPEGGYTYTDFLKSKSKVATGAEDPNDPASFAGATYKLAAKLSKEQTSSSPAGFARGVLNPSQEAIEAYTTVGNVVNMDLRPFSADYNEAAKFAMLNFPSKQPDAIIFRVDGQLEGVDTRALSNYSEEAEILANGKYEIVEATKLDGPSENVKYQGRNVYSVTIKKVESATEQEPVAELPEQEPAQAPADLDELSMVYDLSDYQQVSGPKGSNKGGIFEDSTGKQIYVKEPKSQLHGENEVLASAFYELAGVPAVKVRNGELADGTKVTFSEMVPNSKADFAEKVNDPEYRKKVQDGFVVDAWLANWDVAGTGFDNIVSDANDEPVRVDPGGALLFRAQGAPKGNAFNDKVTELDTLVDPSQNAWSAETFQDMSEQDKAESAKKVLDISNEDIDNYVKATITDVEAGNKLSETLKARRATILERYSLEEGVEDGGRESGEPAGDGDTGGPRPDAEALPTEDGVDGRGDRDGESPWSSLENSVPESARASELREQGYVTPEIFELDPEKDAEAFVSAMEGLKENNKFASSVFIYDLDEYKQMRLFSTADGTAGFGLKPNGDIVSVFTYSNSPHKGGTVSMLAQAVELGGDRLDAYDTILPEIYARAGFRPISRVAWNDDFAPDDWNKETYAKYNNGAPDVVAMAYDPERIGSEYDKSEGTYFDDYDEAMGARDQWIEDSKFASAEPTKLTGYEIVKNENGVYSPKSSVNSDDSYALRTGEKVPPSLPFIPVNTDSGDVTYFDSNGVRRWGQYGASGALLRRQKENGEFEFLIAKRSGKTSTAPNKWSVPGGAHLSEADKGTQVTARNELSEELGLALSERARTSYVSQPSPDWSYSYELLDVENLEDYDFKLSDEISDTKWVSAEELSQLQVAGELHEDFNQEVINNLVELSNNNSYSPSTITSTKWWKHDKDENGNLIQFAPKQGSSLEVGDILYYRGSDLLVTSQTSKNSKYGSGIVNVVNPVTGEKINVIDLRKQGPFPVISNNQSAQEQLKVFTGESAYNPLSGKIIDSANVDSPKSKLENGFSDYKVYPISYPDGAVTIMSTVLENVEEDGTVKYLKANAADDYSDQLFGEIKPNGTNIFDAYVSLDKPELKQKYSFETLEDAKAWVGESLANSLGSSTNPITGGSLGEFNDIKAHKGGFLKPASPAQMDLVKTLLETKQVTPELKERINAQLLKDDYVGGEAGVHISQLKALEDLPEEEAKANFTSSEDATLDLSFTPDTSDSEIFVTRPEDELDPAKILDALRKSHLNSYNLDNGDLVIGTREYTTAYNKSYKYEVVVRRTKDQERFFAYVRKTDMQTGDISVLRASKDGHSYKTMMTKLASVKQGILSSTDPNTWFNKKKSGVESLVPDFDLSEQIDLVASANTKQELESQIKDILATIGGSSFNINKAVLAKLEKAVANGVLSRSYLDDVFQRMVASKMEQANDVPDYLLGNIDKTPPYPHMSFNGRQVKEGDYVDWTDIKTGQVFRGQVKHLKYKHGTKGYVYSDQVLVEFSQLEKQRWRVSSNLVVVDKGDPISQPFYAKSYEYANPEKVLNTAPEAQGPTPNIEQLVPKQTPPSEPDVAPSLVLETSTPELTNGFLKINDSTAVVPSVGGESALRIVSGTKTSKKMSELELGDYIVIGQVSDSDDINADEVLFNGPTADGKNVIVTHKSMGPNVGKLFVIDKDSITSDVSIPVTVPTKKKVYQNFEEVEIFSKFPPSTPTADPLPNQAVVLQEVIQDVVNNTTDGQKIAESVGDLKEISTAVTNKVNEAPDGDDPVFDANYGNYNVRFIKDQEIITRSTKANPANFFAEKLYYNELKPGDIIVKGVGANTTYAQVVSTSEKNTYYTRVRSVPSAKNSMYSYWSDKLAESRESKLDKTDVRYYPGKLRVLRPTKEFKDSGYVKKVEKPAPPLPTGETVNGVSVFANYDDFKANVVDAGSDEFYESFGIPEDVDGIPYSKAIDGGSQATAFNMSYGKLSGKISNNYRRGVIGQVVEKVDSLGGNSYGIVTSTDSGFLIKDGESRGKAIVQWMSGPLAGQEQVLFDPVDSEAEEEPEIRRNVTTNPSYFPIERARALGVKFNEAQLERAKEALDEYLELARSSAKSKLESEAKQKEISKLKAKNTNFGAGASIEPERILGWDETDSNQTLSLESALSKISQNVTLASNGQDVLVDAGDIEDNKIKVFKVIEGVGPMEERRRMTRMAFSLNSWTTDERKGSKGTVGELLERIKNGDKDVTMTFETKVPKLSRYSKKTQNEEGVVGGKPVQEGELLAGSDYWHLTSGEGTTFRVNIKNDAGENIGYYLLHRANRDAKTPTFIGKGAKKAPIAFHNKVDVYLKDDASFEDIETALRATGVGQARPATKADIQILNENKIISLFGVKSNGAVNYSGALREKILKDTYDQYGIRAEDMEAIEKNGDIYYALPKEQGAKLASLLKTEYLSHQFRAREGSTDEEQAEFLFRLLSSDGLKSTVKRWESGINTTGMSSRQDTFRVGANYVFATKESSDTSLMSGGVHMQFDVNEIFRRLDFYANKDDKFGAKQNVNMVDLIASQANLYEVLFKGSISWDMLSKLKINNEYVREGLRKRLLEAGMDRIGNRTVEELLGPAPEEIEVVPGTVQFDYENGNLETNMTAVSNIKSGDLVVVNGKVSKVEGSSGGDISTNLTVKPEGKPTSTIIKIGTSDEIEKIVGGSKEVKLLENGMQAYFDPDTGKWYKDSAFTIPASTEELVK